MSPSEQKPAWLTAEKERAEGLSRTGSTVNGEAPRLTRVMPRAPARKQKAFYIQNRHAVAFETLVFELRGTGVKAPELAEQAIELLLRAHNKTI